MGNPRRYFENNCVYFLTNRLARGLPFVPCEYINKILLGIMAKSSERYPNIKISHFLWMSNHYHMIIVTKGDPREISGFMNLINGEAAKAVCAFLGIRNVKIWAQRYNPIRLLTPEDVIEKICYLYLNPVTGDLVDKSSKWPGISSYGIKKVKKIKCEYIKPSKIQRLPRVMLSKKIVKELIKKNKKGNEHYLSIDPNAWIDCYEDPDTEESYNSRITNKISLEEKNLELNRKYPVMGAEKVKTQNAYKYYNPKNNGKRVFCISSCLERRKQFIELYKGFCELCKLAWQKWKDGFFNYRYPPGAFIPPIWPLANTIKFET